MRKMIQLVIIMSLFSMNALLANATISDRLQERLDQATIENALVRAVIVLNDQVDVRSLDQQLYAENASLSERSYRVITSLQNKANETQADLKNYLAAKSESEVAQYKSFWITNMMMVEAKPATIYEMAEFNDIWYMDLDSQLELDEVTDEGPALSVRANSSEIGLERINAHKMWAAGYTGAGALVMGLDTGVDGNHPALSYKWRGNSVPASQAWWDPDGSTFPIDTDSHGTHTVGTMTGLDPATNDTVGVAPGAEWMAARTIGPGGSFQTNNITAYQWAMDPDGNPATTDDMPIAIGCSWRDPYVGDCDATYEAVFTAVEAAGIAIVFSAGNSGGANNSATITTPKNLNTDLVNTWATGGVNGNDPLLPAYSSTSKGPSRCGQTGSLLIKPEASAPAVSVRSSIPGGSYGTKTGTSMACPHVVGALALLKEAHPNRTGTELKMALYLTAVESPSDPYPGEDNTFGMGVIDIYAAHMSLADPDDPNEPENETIYSDYMTPTSIQLDWTDPVTYVNGTPLTNFQIKIYRDGAFLTNVASGTQTFTDNGLTDGQLYEYDLYAADIPNDSMSNKVTIAWHSGGHPVPKSPESFYITDPGGGDLSANWTNPTDNLDGTPLDDLAEIRLYEDGSLLNTFTVTSGDTGAVMNINFTPSVGTHSYYLTAVDNETPANESGASASAYSPISIPFADKFDTPPEPNSDFWLNTTAEVTDQSVNPPSPTYSLALDGHPSGGDLVELFPVDLSGMAGQGLILSYWYQPQGSGNAPESGDSLVLEFKNDQGGWNKVAGYPGTGNVPFVNEVIALDALNPAGTTFFHASFQLRFRNIGTSSASSHFDHWFVDNVFLGMPTNNPQMAVMPNMITDTLLVGSSNSHNIMVYNNQSAPSSLNFSIVENPLSDWLSVSPENGAVSSSQSETVQVLLDATGLAAGTYTAELIISGNDTTNAEDTVTVELVANDSPVIGVSPDSVHFSLATNASDSITVSISNTGSGPLEIFSIEDEEIGLEDFRPLYVQQQQPAIFEEKGTDGTSRGSVTEGAGGPDPFGYKWIDSDEASGPAYQYTDISGTGTVVNLVATGTFDPKDEGMATVSLPWDVKFYGQSYNQFQVNSNGLIVFDMSFFANAFTNSAIPSAANPNGYVAPFWDDLQGDASGDIYTQAVGNKFIVQWHNWNHYSGTGDGLIFQAVFSQNSSTVLFVYENMANAQNDATIGMESMDGSMGLQVSYDQAYVHNQLLTKISKGADWLSANPTIGTIPSGGTLDIMVKADAGGLVGGNYLGNLIISSNDPVNGTVKLPKVSLAVAGPALVVYPDSLAFDSVAVQSVKMDSIMVSNVGADTLNVTILSTNNLFTVSADSFLLDPFTDHKVMVAYSPTAAGFHEGMLKINSNDSMTAEIEIALSGLAVPPTGIGDPLSIPLVFALDQNYPNPFNPTTKIKYQLPQLTDVHLEIFNLLGQKVRSLVNRQVEAGYHEVEWDGNNDLGVKVSSGIYIYRFQAQDFLQHKKMILMK